MLTQFMNDETGATAVEYGLIIAIVGIGIIIGLTALVNGLNSGFTNTAGVVNP